MNIQAPSLRQTECLRAIRDLTKAQGYAPSYLEIGRRLGLSLVRVHQHVTVLHGRGYLERDHKVARSLRLTDAGRAVLAVVS
jgi:SOS-response transcriptional repressor LexA